MNEKASPAKKVDTARAVCPDRNPNTAEAVQQIMITAINTMISLRRAAGEFMQVKLIQ
ncbi:MAG: hypothetical protein IPF95_15620 [Flavobacteriales bacterium]|nr:hypothetical protein [Flavobacteriales bacterium]MBK6945433.1 hypothetical protein [Flavobacteriales bacterium]